MNIDMHLGKMIPLLINLKTKKTMV